MIRKLTLLPVQQRELCFDQILEETALECVDISENSGSQFKTLSEDDLEVASVKSDKESVRKSDSSSESDYFPDEERSTEGSNSDSSDDSEEEFDAEYSKIRRKTKRHTTLIQSLALTQSAHSNDARKSRASMRGQDPQDLNKPSFLNSSESPDSFAPPGQGMNLK